MDLLYEKVIFYKIELIFPGRSELFIGEFPPSQRQQIDFFPWNFDYERWHVRRQKQDKWSGKQMFCPRINIYKGQAVGVMKINFTTNERD